MAITREKIYPVAALARLYTLDLQLSNTPLFCFSSIIFSHFNVVSVLRKRIFLAGLVQSDYSDYSFCKNITQHIADNGIFYEIIQKLG